MTIPPPAKETNKPESAAPIDAKKDAASTHDMQVSAPAKDIPETHKNSSL